MVCYRRKNKLESEEEIKIPASSVDFCPPYRHPRKIWGIGLNYMEHISDLAETPPIQFSGSFMKADTTIIGPEEPIKIPNHFF
ncbi:MAG: hypothetical protein ACTSUN_00175 [Promethearchaeota archaeon]